MKNRIKKEMMYAMKNKDFIARDILRVVIGEIQRNEQSAKGKIELSDNEIIKIIKKLSDNIIANNEDNGEVEILSYYIPKQLSEDELKSLVGECISETGIVNMGQIMGYFKRNYGGQYDGKLLSQIVRGKL